MKKEDFPKISIATCTYNGERIIGEYFEGIFSQDYPKNKIEIILGDGGSSDKTLEIIKKYQKKYPEIISLFHNKKQYSLGKGYGMDQTTKKANGEFIVQLGQDNILVQKDWLTNMVKILLENPEIAGVQSKLSIPKNSSVTDKYINAIGTEDPYAIHWSLNAQIVLYPEKFKYNKKGDFYAYTIKLNPFYYAGDNGFVIRKKDFLESGGYTQDVDNFVRMAKSNKKYTIAVPRNIRLHHKTGANLKHMINKRIYYAGHYMLKNFEEREFYWFHLKKNNFWQNLKFFTSVSYNLAFFPALIKGSRMYMKEKQTFWLVHPFIIWIMTTVYIYTFFYTLLLKKQKEAKI